MSCKTAQPLLDGKITAKLFIKAKNEETPIALSEHGNIIKTIANNKVHVQSEDLLFATHLTLPTT